ncbi:MAG: phosphoribosyl-AMP cyclohydrolase [Acidimicrobiales bacterium]
MILSLAQLSWKRRYLAQYPPSLGITLSPADAATTERENLAMNLLEEGTSAAIDFTKTRRAAASTQGVVPVVLQNIGTKDVLFVGYANEEALLETLATGTAVLWSTSRNELWRKGQSSGDVLEVSEVRVNCEQNALLYLVVPVRGGVCHTTDSAGTARTRCFYRRLTGRETLEFTGGFEPSRDPGPTARALAGRST